MSDFAVSTTFRAKDKVSSKFDRMGRSANKFSSKTSKAFKRASKSATSFGDVTKGILAAGAVQRGLGLVQSGIASVASEFVSFDDAIVSASAKFSDLNLATGQGQKKLLQLKKTARDVGAATEFSATQAGEGLNFLAMAGFTADQAIGLLPGVVDLATAANVDFARATDIASDSLGAFGLMTKDTAQLEKNLVRITDVMAKTAASANTSLEDLFEAAKKGAPQFTGANQRIETFNSLLATMANSGIKGEEAGTQLRNSIINLSKPTPAAAKALKRLGVEVSDADGNFRDIVDIFADMQKGLKTVTGTTKKAALVSEIFGKRSSGLNVILQSNIEDIRKFRQELDNSSGSAKKMADIMRGSLGNQLKAMQSAAIELGFKFFEAFKVQGESGISAITKAIREFDPQPIINGIQTTLDLLKATVQFASALLPLVQPILAFWVTYKAGVLGVWAAQRLLTTASIAHAALNTAISSAQSFIFLASKIGFASAAMSVLNAVMSANPIGLIIIGVAALGAAIFVIVKNWDKITESIGLAVDAVKQFAGPISKIFGGALDVGAATLGVSTENGTAKKQPAAAQGSAVPQGQEGKVQRRAPNEREAQARQSVNLTGQIDINGPENTQAKFQSDGGSIGVSVSDLGAQ